MKIVFMGTPQFAVPSLRALLDAGHEVAGVVAQPDRPAGRGQTLREPPVKEFARGRGLPVVQPEKLRDPAFLRWIGDLSPQAIVVAAYGKILPKALLDLPPHGAINVHGSLLPKYRGAAPIQHAILNGDSVTGITIMQVNERMDAGDILLQVPVEIRAEDTTGSLQARMAEVGAVALVEALVKLERGELPPRPQREEEATLAPRIEKEQGEIDWTKSAEEIERDVRAFNPWPGAYTRLRGKLLKIHRAGVRPVATSAEPGTIIRASDGEIVIAASRHAVLAEELQLEGKRKVAARDFISGHLIREGERLG